MTVGAFSACAEVVVATCITSTADTKVKAAANCEQHIESHKIMHNTTRSKNSKSTNGMFVADLPREVHVEHILRQKIKRSRLASVPVCYDR